MKKRGISEVVTVILIILLSIAAIIIVWQVVRIMIERQEINAASITTDLEIKKAEISENVVYVKVKRNPGEGDIIGVKFVFENGTSSYTETVYQEIKELEERSFSFNLTGKLSNVNKISVYPIIKTEKGNEIIGPVKDSKEVVSVGGPVGCTPDNNVCLNKECGSWQNGTCGNVSCGSCTIGSCVDGQCVIALVGYYVDKNNIGGTCNDARTKAENSITTPWCTIQRAVNLMTAGDVIYVRRGTYYDPGNNGENVVQIIDKSGTASQPITFKNYQGEEVILDVSDEAILNGSRQWTLYSGNIYYADYIGDPVREDVINVHQGTTRLTRKSSIGEMTAGTHYNDKTASRVYVWLTDSSNPNTKEMHVSPSSGGYHANGFFLLRSSYITIDGFKIFYAGSSGILDDGEYNNIMRNVEAAYNAFTGIHSTGSYKVVDNVIVHHNGWRDMPEMRHGIYFMPLDGQGHNIIMNTIAYNNEHDGLKFRSTAVNSNNTIMNSISYNNGQVGIVISDYVEDAKIIGNLAYNNSDSGILLGYDGSFGGGTSLVIGNTAWGNKNVWQGDIRVSMPGTIVKNNVARILKVKDASVATSSDIDYNNWNNDVRVGDTWVTFSNWKSTYGKDSHSLYGDPLFVNLAGDNYHLQASSPAIDKGTVDSRLKVDLAGVSRPQGAAYDIGAYEFVLSCSSVSDCPDRECNSKICVSSRCVYSASADGTSCSDDGITCTTAQVCSSGKCVGSVFDASKCGDQVCYDKSCTINGCVYSFSASGTSCPDDGITCTTNEQCNGAGNCIATVFNNSLCPADPLCSIKTCTLNGCRYSSCVADPLLWIKANDDLADGIATDSSGKNNHGSCTSPSCPTYLATGSHDSSGAYEFDGVNDKIGLTNTMTLKDAAYAFWIYINGSGFTVAKEANILTSQDTRSRILVYRQTSGNIYYYIETDTDGQEYMFYGYQPPYDTWHHVVFNRNESDNVDLYINGVFNSSVSVANANSLTINRINCNSYATRFFPGKLDEIRIFNHSLTSQQISDVYNGLM